MKRRLDKDPIFLTYLSLVQSVWGKGGNYLKNVCASTTVMIWSVFLLTEISTVCSGAWEVKNPVASGTQTKA